MPWNPLIHLPIEEHVELPPSVVAPRIPWEDMEPGQSVFLPQDVYQVQPETLVKLAGNANIRYAEKGWRFVSASVVEGGRQGVRIWRASNIPSLPIDDGIPMPADRTSDRVPWELMEVGQSVWVSLEDAGVTAQTIYARTSSRSRAMRPKRFSAAKETKDAIDGIRIWRVN